jgi:predicted nucleotidyltransferase
MSDDYQKDLDRLLADLDGAGLGGYSAVLHGSAARGDHLPGWSDVNVVLILDAITPDTLTALREPLRRWQAAAETLPLLLTRAEWHRSADAYPLEIAEMQTAYRVLRGQDPLAGMTVRAADLRVALEREFRGKLLRLRQALSLHGDDPGMLGTITRWSAASILLLARGLLLLARRPVPADPQGLLEAAGRLAGFEAGPPVEVVRHRGEEGWNCPVELMRGYLGAVEAAARFVDTYSIGDRA